MASSTATLSAAASDRKARLAQLKSLKRKAPETADPSLEREDVTAKYLSGRNYDHATKGAKLGFEQAPDQGQTTLELKAAGIAAETKRQVAEEEEKHDAPLDLFKLQPKKPNWDLKRDLDQKLATLSVRTDNAIARLVRERIQKQQDAAKGKSNGSGDVEAQGIEGTTLVEATNVRERQDEEDARREREEDEALLDGS